MCRHAIDILKYHRRYITGCFLGNSDVSHTGTRPSILQSDYNRLKLLYYLIVLLSNRSMKKTTLNSPQWDYRIERKAQELNFGTVFYGSCFNDPIHRLRFHGDIDCFSYIFNNFQVLLAYAMGLWPYSVTIKMGLVEEIDPSTYILFKVL